MDTFIGAMTLGCLVCLVACVFVQTALRWYEDRCKQQWMEKSIDLAIMNAAVAQLEQTEEAWQQGLDKQQCNYSGELESR